MEHYLVLGFLGINSWVDIRKRKISLMSVAVFSLAGIIYQCVQKQQSILFLVGLLPGIFLLIVSKATREALGMGDALLMLVLGLYLGLWEAIEVLIWALFLAAVWAGILMFLLHHKRDYAFPFVPFLLLGYLGRWILCR